MQHDPDMESGLNKERVEPFIQSVIVTFDPFVEAALMFAGLAAIPFGGSRMIAGATEWLQGKIGPKES